MTAKKRRAGLGNTLLWILMVLFLLSFFFYFVIFDTQVKDLPYIDSQQPLLSAARAEIISSVAELNAAIDTFPIPVLAGVSGGNLRLLSGVSRDFPFEGGYGRLMQLTLQDAAGRQLQVISGYPVRALSILYDEAFTLTGEGPALAGIHSTRMDSASAIRLHIQTDVGFYAVITQRMSDGELEADIRPLQMYASAK